jgi:glycosyltransferase involved in cell wall biosynthesis
MSPPFLGLADSVMEAAVTASGKADARRDAAWIASVVVPCFNGGRYLDALMVSFERQTLTGFEIIIVDDGSTDAATLQKLASLEGRARVVRQDNRGLSAARNSGIEAARSEFVAVLDCDDTFEPQFLEEAVTLMRDAPAEVAVVFSHLRLTGVGNGLIERHFNPFDLLFTNTLHSGLMLRKACWRAVGGYDETMRQGYEDWEFYLRLAHAGFRGIEIPKPYFNYAVASGGMLFNKSSQLHAVLWRSMRTKHAPLYRPLNILKLWWQTRGSNSHVSLAKALAALGVATVLPDGMYSRMVAERRRRMLLDGHLPAYTGQVPVAMNPVNQT